MANKVVEGATGVGLIFSAILMFTPLAPIGLIGGAGVIVARIARKMSDDEDARRTSLESKESANSKPIKQGVNSMDADDVYSRLFPSRYRNPEIMLDAFSPQNRFVTGALPQYPYYPQEPDFSDIFKDKDFLSTWKRTAALKEASSIARESIKTWTTPVSDVDIRVGEDFWGNTKMSIKIR